MIISRRRVLLVVVPLVLAVGGAVAGCSDGSGSGGGSPSPDEWSSQSDVVVDYTETSVALEVGDTLEIDFGTLNYSIGDDWALVVEPDPAVLGNPRSQSEYGCDANQDGILPVGCESTLAHRFDAIAAGETTIEFQYAYRGSTDEADIGDKVDVPHTSLSVTVG